MENNEEGFESSGHSIGYNINCKSKYNYNDTQSVNVTALPITRTCCKDKVKHKV